MIHLKRLGYGLGVLAAGGLVLVIFALAAGGLVLVIFALAPWVIVAGIALGTAYLIGGMIEFSRSEEKSLSEWIAEEEKNHPNRQWYERN